MKNISLLLNVVLLIAVAFLYYKVYSGNSEKNESSPIQKLPQASIVYINSDSLLDNYPYFTRLKNSMEQKQDSIEGILKGRGKTLESEIRSYQERGASMTDQQRQLEEERLSRKQQEFLHYKEEMVNELGKQEEIINDSLHHNLIDVLKKFNKDKNYQFILGYQKGSGILLANDSLEITKQILEELNKEENKK